MLASLGMKGVGALSSNPRSPTENIAGFGQTPWGRLQGLEPQVAMAKAMQNIENLGAMLSEYAAQPISLPGAFYQPMPSYYGGGMPMVMGPPATDPALTRPGLHLTRPGVRFPEPEIDRNTEYKGLPKDVFGPLARGLAEDADISMSRAEMADRFDPQARSWLFPGGVRRVQPEEHAGYDPEDPGTVRYADYAGGGFRGAEQPGPGQMDIGGGIQGLKDSLAMLGVEEDPFGNMVMGKDWHYRGSPFDVTPDKGLQYVYDGDKTDTYDDETDVSPSGPGQSKPGDDPGSDPESTGEGSGSPGLSGGFSFGPYKTQGLNIRRRRPQGSPPVTSGSENVDV